MGKKKFLGGFFNVNILGGKQEKNVNAEVEKKEEVVEENLSKQERIVRNLKIDVTNTISDNQKKLVEQKHKAVMLFFLDRMQDVTKSCTEKGGKNKVQNVIEQRMEDLKFVIASEEAYKRRYNEGKPEQQRNNLFMPAGYYSIKENSVYMKVEPYLREGFSKSELPRIVLSTLVHETLHGVSTNQKDKVGLMMVEKSSEDSEKIIGRGLNEAATVDLTEKVLGKSRVNGYSEDYKEVLNTIKSIANIKEKEYLKMYFVDNKWYNKELEKRFNPSPNNKNGLKKIIVNYDNRNVNTKFSRSTVVKNLYEGFANNYILKDEEEKEKYEEKFKKNMQDLVDYFEMEDLDLETEKYIEKATINKEKYDEKIKEEAKIEKENKFKKEEDKDLIR